MELNATVQSQATPVVHASAWTAATLQPTAGTAGELFSAEASIWLQKRGETRGEDTRKSPRLLARAGRGRCHFQGTTGTARAQLCLASHAKGVRSHEGSVHS